MLFNLSRHFTCLNNELQVWTRWRHVDQRQTCPVSHRSGLCYRCFQNQLKSCLLVLSELWREGLTMVMTLMTLKTWITYPKLQQNIFKIHGFFMLKWYAWLFYVLLFFRSNAESIHMYLIRPMDGLWVTRKPYGVWCCHPFISGSSHNRVTWKKKGAIPLESQSTEMGRVSLLPIANRPLLFIVRAQGIKRSAAERMMFGLGLQCVYGLDQMQWSCLSSLEFDTPRGSLLRFWNATEVLW